ncbi:growth hormone-regulated TBC protein 1b isoform X2 [Tachysurus fulvidraco]|uniref:growth hormone-regulated TBC protein 1b isoform X2 n=1 Tax=Tachysurus fulvidraco TaxID=1234273 RepID=UPI001FEEBB1E|nr:growth hormone-regulated TBC protein 1b isoform X2 [Tachysurus fulvidraco]
MNLPMDSKSTEGLTSSGNSSVDKYGFQYAEDFNYEAYEEMMSEYFPVLARRSEKWSRLLKENTKVDKNLKVKRYVRKGVPSEHRTLIWMAASGAQQQLQMNCGHYNSLLKAHHDPKLEEAIRTDNIQFHESSQHCLLNALYNVLLAYGHHNKDVGYCQGMNFIAGYLLIITTDEEKSFWLMDALLGRILPDYYTPAMLGLKTDQEVLGELVKTKMPAVWQVMARHNVTWGLVVSKWFICLYIDVLPMETVLRIWDSLFYEGSKILFRVALTLISHNQKLILKAQNVLDICHGFKQMTHGEFVENCHAFMQNIFTEPGSLSMATVTKLREICRERMQAQDSA